MKLLSIIRDWSLKQKLLIPLALSCSLLLMVGLAAWWEASSALRRSARLVSQAGEIRFTVARFERMTPGVFEPVSAPAVFSHARFLGPQLFVCGPSGLYGYDDQGEPVIQFQVGIDLPAAPLVVMERGIAAGASEQELFIGTAGEGLLAFNGRSFRQIRPEDNRYRTVTAVLPLPTGRVLMGTKAAGVLAYDGRRITSFHPSLNGLQVTALAGSESALWVGTRDRGVLFFHAGQLDSPTGLPDPQVLSLAVQGSSTWVGTPAGVAEFRDGRFTRVLAPGVFARALLPRHGTLAIGTQDEGVFELPLEATPGRARPSPEPLGGAVRTLFEARGKLFALAEDGLYAARGSANGPVSGWQQALRRPSALLADRNISSLALDTAGRLWVGYFDRGLDILDPGFSRATHVENDYVFCVNRVVPDAGRGLTLVATANGLVFFDAGGRQRQIVARREGLIADHVTDVALDGANTVVATPAGLTFLGAAGAHSLYAFHGLVNNHVYALAASKGRVLAGTLGGVSMLEQGAVRASYTTANSALTHNWITAIVPVGDDWFAGTYGGGIFRLDHTGRWEAFSDARGFEVNPNAMLVTSDHVFVGTLANGLYVFDRARGRWHAVTAGLPSPNVTALAAGGGYIYVGTENGLARVSEQKVLP